MSRPSLLRSFLLCTGVSSMADKHFRTSPSFSAFKSSKLNTPFVLASATKLSSSQSHVERQAVKGRKRPQKCVCACDWGIAGCEEDGTGKRHTNHTCMVFRTATQNHCIPIAAIRYTKMFSYPLRTEKAKGHIPDWDCVEFSRVLGEGRRAIGDGQGARCRLRCALPSLISFPFLSFPFLSLPFLPFLLSSSPLLSPYLFVPLLFSLFTASHAHSVRNASPPLFPSDPLSTLSSLTPS